MRFWTVARFFTESFLIDALTGGFVTDFFRGAVGGFSGAAGQASVQNGKDPISLLLLSPSGLGGGTVDVAVEDLMEFSGTTGQ